MTRYGATQPHPDLTQILADRAALVVDCGHHATEPTAFHQNGVPLDSGYAVLPDDTRVCYDCADRLQREDMLVKDEVWGYLSGDGKKFTTWTGGELARVTEEGAARTGWHGKEITYIRAVSPDGRRWYGKNGGRGMALRLKAAKR